MMWQAGRFELALDKPKIMGIVNVTPDSFSDGGTYAQSVKHTLEHAQKLLRGGADILDAGGESTRPGADFVPPEEEWRRLSAVLPEMARWGVPLSVDTRRSEIMRRVLDNGWADIINDVQALEDAGAAELLARHPTVGVCLMHMKGLPQTMQNNPSYGDVAAEVAAYLNDRAAACEAAGIARRRLVLDPGFGFGKTLATYDLARKLDAQKVLIVTNRPSIANSWFDDFGKFIAWQTDFSFVSTSDSLKDRPVLTRDQFLQQLG